MKTFLQQTAESVIRTIEWKQLNRTTLVLPSHRAGLVLKDEIMRLQQEQHAQAVWAPQVQTLTQLQDALSPLYAEDELFTIVRLYRHYRRLNAGDKDLMPLEMFYGWGRQMLADFTNVDASMPAAQVPNFFENSIAAHELEQWTFDPSVEERLRSLVDPMSVLRDTQASAQSIRAQYERLWKQIYELYTALREEMQAEQKGYAGLRQRAVIDHWDEESVQHQLAGRRFVFVGFNYLLPVERDLMMRLRDAGQALFYWDYVPDFRTNEKAFSFAQLNSGMLGNALPARSWDERGDVTMVSCVSREAQAQYVHRWLQENYTAKGQKVGVVICDETMLEPVIYALPAITLPGETTPVPVNITKGFPLRNTAVYARVLEWVNDRQRGKADEAVSPAFIDDLLHAVFPVAEENPVPEEVPEETGALSWKELLVLESEYQVRKIINQMRLLVTKGIEGVPFTLKLLRLLLRRMMESVTMPFHGEPVTDVQVMGVLETRMLDFDKLLLLNVEEGVLPQRQPDISFIPFYLRKTYHMQTSDERASVYAYNFFRLLSRAQHATLLYTSAETAEGGKGMSRFLMQILYSDEFKVQKAQLQEANTLSTHVQIKEADTVSLLSLLHKDEKGILRRADGSAFRLSPSALNTYITCPRSFYLQYIAGLRPKEAEDALFEPNTMGSFVHHTMEYIYTHFLHCDNTAPVRIRPEEVEAVRTDEAKKEQALRAAYAAMNERYAKDHPEDTEHYIPEHHHGENVIILGYVSNILERDREDARTGLQMYLLEQERSFPVTIDGIGTLLTGGTIDRLDIYGAEGTERLRVVDYKSGGYNDDTHARKMSSTWEELMENEDKAYVRQTLMYSHAVLRHDKTGLPVEPHLFFCRRKLTEIETTIDVENETVRDYKALQEPFLQALQTKIAQVLQTTQFPQCDEKDCPSFCPFFTLCGRKATEY